MEQKRKTRTWCGFLLLLVLLAVFLIWNLFAGSVQLSASQIGQILLGGGDDLTQKQIIMQIRLPRMASALILGGALSVSGYLLQTFFHNPIAGPFVLGISSGAKLAVSLVMIFLLSRGVRSSSALLIGAAFVGAMLSMGLILLISQRVNQMSLLVVCGVMIGYICSALTDFLVTFADDSNIVNLHNWSNGSFSGMKWENVTTMAWVCRIALILTFFQADPRLSARRGLRAQHGRADQGVPRGAHPALQRVICLRDGLRRPHLVCRHRAAAPDEGAFQDGGAAFADPGELPRRGHLLPCV
jgi:iron complex transport system permease protein